MAYSEATFSPFNARVYLLPIWQTQCEILPRGSKGQPRAEEEHDIDSPYQNVLIFRLQRKSQSQLSQQLSAQTVRWCISRSRTALWDLGSRGWPSANISLDAEKVTELDSSRNQGAWVRTVRNATIAVRAQQPGTVAANRLPNRIRAEPVTGQLPDLMEET